MKDSSARPKSIPYARALHRPQSYRPRSAGPQKPSIFFSCRFADSEFMESLSRFFNREGFEVVTGKSANKSISKAVLGRIKECSFFLCLMTRDEAKADGSYTTSPWLLEEIGAALAFGKPLVLMVQDGVTGIGGLQGDWQRIHFNDKNFLNAALDAVEQLESYI